MVNYAQYIPTSLLTTQGDLLFENATPAAARLPIGSAGNVLTVAAGLPAWAASPSPAKAATTTSGYVLVNSTGNVISWTTPNDSAQHAALVFAQKIVTSNETGGAIQIQYTDPGGNSRAFNLFPGGQTNGDQQPGSPAVLFVLAAPNTAVTIAQTSALSVGASTLWAALWGA